MRVGVRELKAHLSAYLADVAVGGEIVVTDHGRPVARLTAYAAPSEVERGIDEGWIEAPRRNGLAASGRRSRSVISTLDVLNEDRG